MKKKLIVLTMALVIFASPVFVKADYYWMSSGFIERAEVKDGITATASGWFWTWPTYLNGFGIGGTAEIGNMFLNNLAVGGGAYYDRIKFPIYNDSKWQDIAIAGFAKYQIISSEEMYKKIEFLPLTISVLGGLKFNIYTFTINGVKYGIGDTVTGTYYEFYDNFITINALALADYPLSYVVDSEFFRDTTITYFIGLINSRVNTGIYLWYTPEEQNFSVNVGWFPILGLNGSVYFNF